MAEPLRVLLADDHPVVRQGLRTFLASREGIDVVGEAADAEEAVTRTAMLKPDVVLLDLVMPRGGGVAAIERIRALGLDARVLVLTSFAGDDQLLPALRAGAAGYLLKDADPAELEQALRAVGRGEAALHPTVAARVLREVAGGPSSGRLGTLTAREREVLGLLGQGLTNRQIARRLGIAEKTVKTHVSSVLGKLGLADRTQAALLAVREGLVPGS